MAKFSTTFQLNSSNEIVEPIIQIEKDETRLVKVAENVVYNFKIKNYKNNELISNIDIEYYIEIITSANVNYKIYKNNKEINLYNNKTEIFLLNKNLIQEDIYQVKILFSNNKYQEIEDEVYIKIDYEQKNI